MASLSLEELLEYQSRAHRAYEILLEELNKRSIKFKMVEAFYTFNFKTVGVKGDQRVYSYPLFISVIKHGRRPFIDYNFLQSVSTRLTNEIKDLCRVVYFLKPKKGPNNLGDLFLKPPYIVFEGTNS